MNFRRLFKAKDLKTSLVIILFSEIWKKFTKKLYKQYLNLCHIYFKDLIVEVETRKIFIAK